MVDGYRQFAIARLLGNARFATGRRVSLAATVLAVCAMQLVYAATAILAVALAVTVIGGAALVSAEVVAETTLARIVPAETLGRVVGVFDAGSVAAMIAGAVLAPIVIRATSLKASFVILGGGDGWPSRCARRVGQRYERRSTNRRAARIA